MVKLSPKTVVILEKVIMRRIVVVVGVVVVGTAVADAGPRCCCTAVDGLGAVTFFATWKSS